MPIVTGKQRTKKGDFGPFILRGGRHIEIDHRESARLTKLAQDDARATGVHEGSELPADPKEREAAIKSIKVTAERHYKVGDPPFYSDRDLCKLFNVEGFAPKFELAAVGAKALGIDEEMLRRPGETLTEFAARMSEYAAAHEGKEEPEPAAQQQQPKGKR